MLSNQSANAEEKQLWAFEYKYADVCKVPDIKNCQSMKLLLTNNDIVINSQQYYKSASSDYLFAQMR